MLEAFGANESVGEVNREEHGDGTTENIVECHGASPVKVGRRLWCKQSRGRKIRLLWRVELCPSSILTPVVLLESDKTKGAIHRMAPFMLSGVEMILGSLGHQYAAEAHKLIQEGIDRAKAEKK